MIPVLIFFSWTQETEYFLLQISAPLHSSLRNTSSSRSFVLLLDIFTVPSIAEPHETLTGSSNMKKVCFQCVKVEYGDVESTLTNVSCAFSDFYNRNLLLAYFLNTHFYRSAHQLSQIRVRSLVISDFNHVAVERAADSVEFSVNIAFEIERLREWKVFFCTCI